MLRTHFTGLAVIANEQKRTHILLTHKLSVSLEQSRNDCGYEKEWHTVLDICGYIEVYSARYESYYLQQMVYYLLFDEYNYNSIDSLIKSIRNNARNTRDLIPNELWEEWNELYLSMQVKTVDEEFTVLKTTEFLTKIRKTSLTATGIIDSLMTRDECFQFVKIGKWIERSEKTALIVLRLLENEDVLTREIAVTSGLQLTNSFEEYTRRFRIRTSDNVLNFLMGDTKCSRSVAYGIRKIKRTVLDIEEDSVSSPYAQEMFEALEQLELIVQKDASLMSVEQRKEWVKEIHTQCSNFGPVFARTYYLNAPILVD